MRHVTFGAVCAVSGARKVVEGMAAICHLSFVIRVEKKISHRFKVQFGRILDNLWQLAFRLVARSDTGVREKKSSPILDLTISQGSF